MVKDLLAGFEHHSGYPKADGAVLSIPGRFWSDSYDQINEALTAYRWVLVFRVSDEEDWFDCRKIEHPNAKFYIQTPRFGTDRYPAGSRFLPVGYTPHVRLVDRSHKLLNVFLSGQDTHARRHECFASLEGLRNSRIHRTAGFTQGMDPGEYARCCGLAKVMPCPSGAISVDSFRVWEALEAGALPVVDTVSPTDGPTDYWTRVLGDVPFPLVSDWSTVGFGQLLQDWPNLIGPVNDWYRGYKRRLALELREDLDQLGAT